MLIALYDSPRDLPGCHGGKGPSKIFSLENANDWKGFSCRSPKETETEPTTPFVDHWAYPMLVGIANLEIPSMMAHISLAVNEQGIIGAMNHVGIEISTIPDFIDGAPQITVNGETQTIFLLEIGFDSLLKTPQAWRQMVLTKLLRKKDFEGTRAKRLKRRWDRQERIAYIYGGVPDIE